MLFFYVRDEYARNLLMDGDAALWRRDSPPHFTKIFLGRVKEICLLIFVNLYALICLFRKLS